MKAPTYHGNYLGIVVQNNDPLKRGRVKIFVPHVSPTVYKGWNEIKRDKKFKFVGVNTYSDLTGIVDELKKILPWAECASPLVGENTSGRFYATNKVGSISDSNKNTTFATNLTSNEVNASSITPYSQNYDNIGEKPGNLFDISYFKLKDAFNSPKDTNVNNVNKFSYNYTPETYSNSAKGSFSVPSVGSHVWAFFVAGDVLKPVYFATSFGAEDWSSIYDTGSAADINNENLRQDAGVDYPGEFENKINNDPTLSTETYRNKFVINQKGGTLAFVNTDNKETLKLTHYSGSFKEFNNFTNIELATKNDQKLILEDSFLTIQGDRNEYTGRDYDLNTVGNFYKKIGKINSDLATQWKSIVSELADIKQLFDIQRADKVSNTLLKFSSNKQRKAGTHAPCPVCRNSTDSYFVYNISYNPAFDNLTKPSLCDSTGNYAYGNTIYNSTIFKSILYPGVAGVYVYTSPVSQLGGAVDGSTFTSTPATFLGTKPCPACGGSGLSPSSFQGNWTPSEKQTLINKFFKEKINSLSEIEKQLGLGGNEIIEISKHKIETIGTVMNDFGSIRIDPKGKMNASEIRIADYGSFVNRKPSPVHEYVNVTDLPGGDYTLNICNRFNVLVGAGGINMKSYGPVNISGTITNVAGEQVNIGSENEINIDGGKRVSIVGDIISIRQRNKKQVLVDSTLGVSKNTIVLGGGYYEGELFVQHVTAPTEIQETNETICYGAAVTDASNGNGKVIGYAVPLPDRYVAVIDSIAMTAIAARLQANTTTGVVTYNGVPGNVSLFGSGLGAGGVTSATMPIVVYGTGRDEDSILVSKHSHMFKNLPLTLKNTNAEVRQAAQTLQDSVPVPNGPIANAKK
jgi:hypothetical protein